MVKTHEAAAGVTYQFVAAVRPDCAILAPRYCPSYFLIEAT